MQVRNEYGSYHIVQSTGYIMNVLVSVDHRREGRGRMLMRELVTHFGDMDLQLDCRKELIPFYSEHGFVLGNQSDGFFSRNEHYVHMVRPARQEALT